HLHSFPTRRSSDLSAGLRRAREAVAQLRAVLLHALPVAEAVLDARREPERLRIDEIRVGVDATDVEARALVFAAVIEHIAQVDGGRRTGGIELVRARERAFGLRPVAGARLADALGEQRARRIAVLRHRQRLAEHAV